MGWWAGRAMASSRESEKPQNPGNNRAEYGRHFHISSIFLPLAAPTRERKPCNPQHLALSQPGERAEGGEQGHAGTLSSALSPLPAPTPQASEQ